MIIGFSGVMGAGKTEALIALKFVTQDTKYKIHVCKFAQPLYDIQDYTYRRISSVYTRPEEFVKDRLLLRFLGLDWGRDTISQSLWLDLWRAEALKKEKEGYIVVADDVRFDNEAEEINKLGGKVILVHCLDTSKRKVIGADLNNHGSEQGVNVKYLSRIIDNNYSLSQYQDSLIAYFKTILDLNNETK